MLIKYNVLSTPALRIDNRPLYKVYKNTPLGGDGTQNNPLTITGKLTAKGTTNDATDYAIKATNSDGIELLSVLNNGKVNFWTTFIAPGNSTTQTIYSPTGVINLASGASSVSVTSGLVTTSSTVFAVIRSNDTTAVIKNVVPTNGAFTINLTAAATAETSIGFFIIN